jgi:hypothetical protein
MRHLQIARKTPALISIMLIGLTVLVLPTCKPLSNTNESTLTPNAPQLDTPHPTPSATPIPTGTSIAQNTPKPTTEARMESIDYFDKQCNGYFMPEFISPSQEWAICGDTEKIMVIGRNGIRWEFLVTEKYDIQQFEPEIAPVFWTLNGEYVFIRYFHLVDGGFIYGSTTALWRMDLQDGSMSELIKPTVKNGHLEGRFYALSISPTGRRMVYVDQSLPPVLNIVDLLSGAVVNLAIPEPYTNAGKFDWSPDGQKLILELAGPQADHWPVYFGAMWVSFPESSSKVFISESSSYLSIQEMTNDYVRISNESGHKWQLDFATGRVVQE